MYFSFISPSSSIHFPLFLILALFFFSFLNTLPFQLTSISNCFAIFLSSCLLRWFFAVHLILFLPISYLQPLSLPLEISRPSLGLISASRNLLFRTIGIAWPHHTTAAKDTVMGFYTVNKAMRDKGQTNVCIKKLCTHLFISIKNYWCDQSKFCTHGNTNVNIVMSEIRFDIKVVINPNWTIIIPPSLPPPHRLDKWRKTLPPSFPAPPPPTPTTVLIKGKKQ